MVQLGSSINAARESSHFAYTFRESHSGAVVLGGGFDTVLTLFDASGNALAENDDGVGVAIDPSTGQAWDARFTQLLAPGSYIMSVSQYDNFVTGNNIRDGFNRLGESAFTELVAIQSFD